MHFQTYDFRSGCPDYFQSQDPSKIIGRVSNYADSDEFSNISDFKEQESDIVQPPQEPHRKVGMRKVFS